ncbi:MAG: hypothetical protein KGJ02_05940 [Verrucomicrobiota bacterium]|nr:hypothetical protein [Verrucomicrobiota bacterium]
MSDIEIRARRNLGGQASLFPLPHLQHQREPQQARRRACCELESEHMEEIVRAIAAITVDPIRNLASFFLPSLAAYFSNYTAFRATDGNQIGRYGDTSYRQKVLDEVEALRKASGLWRDVGTYTSDYHALSSCGGSFSFTDPALIIPYHRIYRPGMREERGDIESILRKNPYVDDPSSFARNIAKIKNEQHAYKARFLESTETDNKILSKNPYFFTDDETRFFITRQLANISANYALLRVAVKVIFIVALFSIFALPVGWMGGLTLLLIDIGIYVFSERLIQRFIDIQGVKTLKKRFETAALETLDEQNAHLLEIELTLLGWRSGQDKEPFLNFLTEETNDERRNLRQQAIARLSEDERKNLIQKNDIPRLAEERAATAAYSALKKMAVQNILRRSRENVDVYNPICRVYVRKNGDNWLDVNHPFLSTRVKQLEKHYPFLNNVQPPFLGRPYTETT